MRRPKRDESRVNVVSLDVLMREFGFSEDDLHVIERTQKVLGDPRVRVQVTPTIDGIHVGEEISE